MGSDSAAVDAALREADAVVKKLEFQFGMNIAESGRRAVAGVLYQQAHGGTPLASLQDVSRDVRNHSYPVCVSVHITASATRLNVLASPVRKYHLPLCSEHVIQEAFRHFQQNWRRLCISHLPGHTSKMHN